jgi:hypothetical protein
MPTAGADVSTPITIASAPVDGMIGCQRERRDAETVNVARGDACVDESTSRGVCEKCRSRDLGRRVPLVRRLPRSSDRRSHGVILAIAADGNSLTRRAPRPGARQLHRSGPSRPTIVSPRPPPTAAAP